MNRTEAKARLTELRKDLDRIDASLNRLVDELFEGTISEGEATEQEFFLKQERAQAAAEFKAVNSLPCCNI